jgi:hypothetical protein
MSEDRLHITFGIGNAGSALARSGRPAVSRHWPTPRSPAARRPSTTSITSPSRSTITAGGSVSGGVRHNMPQEAPQAFAQAVVDVDGN